MLTLPNPIAVLFSISLIINASIFCTFVSLRYVETSLESMETTTIIFKAISFKILGCRSSCPRDLLSLCPIIPQIISPVSVCKGLQLIFLFMHNLRRIYNLNLVPHSLAPMFHIPLPKSS